MLRDRIAQDLQLLLDIELPFKMYLVEGVQTFICAYWILRHLQYWILLIYWNTSIYKQRLERELVLSS